jgi:exodeoxyribonuclease V alpha subunit
MDETQITDEQHQAINLFRHSRLMLVVGGPGTGKTTLIKFLIDQCPNKHKLLLGAPTGTATLRITHCTNFQAHVIAMVNCSAALIEQYRGGIMILDEGSMISISQLYPIWLNLRPRKVVVVGDPNQLPPPSGDSVLNTLIKLPNIPTVRLTLNLRQLIKNSLLVQSINKIQKGERLDPNAKDDSFEIRAVNANELISEVKKLYFEFEKECQILTFKNDTCGLINTATIDPDAEKLDDKFKIGDRIICNENYYQTKNKKRTLKVGNGTLGYIVAKKLIRYDNDFEDVKNATKYSIARAITVHKSQGSEFDMPVIMVLSNWGGGKGVPMELFYTGVTRAKSKVVIVGLIKDIRSILNGKFTN